MASNQGTEKRGPAQEMPAPLADRPTSVGVLPTDPISEPSPSAIGDDRTSVSGCSDRDTKEETTTAVSASSLTMPSSVSESDDGEKRATRDETQGAKDPKAENAVMLEELDDNIRLEDKEIPLREEVPPIKEKPIDPAHLAKAQEIRSACDRADFAQLQALAESEGGFLNDELRQIAWPTLLGVSVGALDQAAPVGGWKELPQHRDEEQVELDVNRAFVHYPRHTTDAEEERQKRALSDLIVEVLRRHPFLCYFQGFHDICQVFLLVLPPPLRTPSVLRLAVLRIRDFMLPTIDAAVQQLLLLPDILHAADPPLWAHLRLAQHPRPFFALSGTLTMYAHDVRSLGAIARLFDVLLARPPAFSLYLFAAIVCAHRDALFATPADEPEMLHHILSKLPGRAGEEEEEAEKAEAEIENEKRSSKASLNEKSDPGTIDADDGDVDSRPAPHIDTLVRAATKLADAFPPHTLASWRTVSRSSVLKTASDPAHAAATQTLEDGEKLFYAHVREIEQAERRRQQREHVRALLWRYRGPIRAVGVAVLVGVVAILLRRSGNGGGGGGALGASSILPGRPGSVSSLLSSLGLRR